MSHRTAARLRRALALASLVALAQGAAAQTAVLAPPANVLQLSAEASTEVPQDLLAITLQVVREGSDAATVQSQLRQVLDAALTEARKAQRPGQLDVRTGAFSLYPRTAPKGGIAGWQGMAELVLEGRDLPAISALAGKLPGLSVARVGFGLSREARERVAGEVSAEAIAKFRQRAASYAQQFGFGGWSVREVNISGGDVGPSAPVPMFRVARAMAAAPADESQPVEAGRATVSVTVSGSIQMSPR
ncbi:SIMPL domain-containing protein [Ideonella sp. DXS22W]|uniref:SIMPL domain-containing protein n=1 Tax=Pseudaquabacterium inlustre TaxID=2984192 RepID=A0ABU9CMK8_9BURK